MKFNNLIFCTYLFFTFIGNAQQIPSKKVIENSKLSSYLTAEVKAKLSKGGNISEVTLANYLREKFSERYFYNWKNFDERFTTYKEIYPTKKAAHTENALDHINKYNDSTQWILPFNYLNGEPVNAYALRHLARQHKMVDIAYYYHYQDKNSQYLDYFTNQLNSLNVALDKNEYETIENGNGVYEAFRSGYRVLNWLHIHNMFLGESEYSDEDQLKTIATLLQHAAYLYERNPVFHAGNHQTRGLSALAMIAVLLRDFEGADNWYKHAMKLLEAHMSKEINDDGFQFERSVHYHMSDIGNYYYVYQLAKISNIKVGDFWENQLKALFTTLTKIAYPDKSAPVLQDDTDNPWAEKNDISGALTLGYLLFEDPAIGYFANTNVAAKMYWYLNNKQLQLLNSIQKVKPTISSVEFPTTGYYIQREGWEANDKMMIISAGLDAFKPDHQHGDMLGIQAMANGKVILPNYQVRYSLKDYGFFKNSMVKNVALVNDELQGKKYTSNQGGSGFGKFKELPNPTVINWITTENYDVFAGSHDGFKNLDVDYSRQIIYIKNDFWIVKDNFKASKEHNYKQVWQGHYSFENKPNLLRVTFDDASGSDIFQLRKIDNVEGNGSRGKQWAVVSKKATNFNFITAVFPYKGYSNRIDELSDSPVLKGWDLNKSNFKLEGNNVVSLSKDASNYIFDVTKITYNNTTILFSETTDIYVVVTNNELTIQLLGLSELKVTILSSNKEYSEDLKFNTTISIKL